MPSKRNAYLRNSLNVLYLDNTILKSKENSDIDTGAKSGKAQKIHRLPKGFGPNHPDWKIPSKRNLYIKLVEEGKL